MERFAPSRPEPGAARRSSAAPVDLFCLPYAGGSSRVYAGWERHLPAAVRARPLELPGRGTRFQDRPHDRLDPLVADLLPALLPARGTPYALFGYSLGALLAFELARQMARRYDSPPVHLFVAAFRAPHLPRATVPDYDLPDDRFRERLRAFGGTPEEVMADESLMRLIVPILRADLAVADTYAYRDAAPLSCPVTAFAGSDDPEAPVASVAHWRRQTAAGFTLKVLEGGHFFLNDQEEGILREVTAVLAPP